MKLDHKGFVCGIQTSHCLFSVWFLFLSKPDNQCVRFAVKLKLNVLTLDDFVVVAMQCRKALEIELL